MESIIAARIPYQKIRVMFDKAARMEREGKKIIHLEIGRPDFNTPAHIVEAAVAALQAGKHHYSQNAGVLELRQAIVEKFDSDYGLEYDPETETVVTNGVAEGIYAACHALLNPGDQVLIPDPRWVNYDVVVSTCLAVPVSYSLREDRNYQADPNEIEDKITPQTRMIMLASPSNPTGAVASRNVMEKVAQIAIKHDLVVLSDEIYSKIIYPSAEHVCAATVEGMRERTIVLNGFSKFYSMTGWRLGYVLGPKEMVDPILRYHQYMLTSTNTFAQWGAIAALKEEQIPSENMVAEFRRRRDYLYDAVNSLPGFSCVKPEGAFYLFPAVRETGMDGIQLSDKLLEEAGVATVAGEYFGQNGAGHLRLSYANSLENLEAAVERIRKCLD